MTAHQVRQWTTRDPVLSKVRTWVLQGWVDGEGEEIVPFNRRSKELSVQDGCILWGNRVVIPERGRHQVLQQLHDGQPGVTRMKSIARSLTWWPGIDKDIEQTVHNCQPCQQNQKAPAQAPLHSWEWQTQPWMRLHIDHIGPFLGKYFLVVVDAHSKWIEVVTVPSTSTQHTIRQLRLMLATHGLPKKIVSHNATSFTSAEIQEFVTRNGICHITSAPYHPATNELAKRAVQTFKNAMKKVTPTDLDTAVAQFLFHYRNIPHSTTGATPAQLLLGRQPRMHNDMMRPKLSTRVREAQLRKQATHNSRSKEHGLSLNDPVYVRNFSRHGPAWILGEITQVHGSQSFTITLNNGQITRRHIEHVCF